MPLICPFPWHQARAAVRRGGGRPVVRGSGARRRHGAAASRAADAPLPQPGARGRAQPAGLQVRAWAEGSARGCSVPGARSGSGLGAVVRHLERSAIVVAVFLLVGRLTGLRSGRAHLRKEMISSRPQHQSLRKSEQKSVPKSEQRCGQTCEGLWKSSIGTVRIQHVVDPTGPSPCACNGRCDCCLALLYWCFGCAALALLCCSGPALLLCPVGSLGTTSAAYPSRWAAASRITRRRRRAPTACWTGSCCCACRT